MNSENYGTHIKHIRQKMGLTQNQVAEALGVTPGYISNVENNRTAMSLRILTYYAKLCGCSLDSLVGTLDPEYSETALDRKLYNAIMQLDVDTKEKLLKTIEIWNLQSRLACMFYCINIYNKPSAYHYKNCKSIMFNIHPTA